MLQSYLDMDLRDPQQRHLRVRDQLFDGDQACTDDAMCATYFRISAGCHVNYYLVLGPQQDWTCMYRVILPSKAGAGSEIRVRAAEGSQGLARPFPEGADVVPDIQDCKGGDARAEVDDRQELQELLGPPDRLNDPCQKQDARHTEEQLHTNGWRKSWRQS